MSLTDNKCKNWNHYFRAKKIRNSTRLVINYKSLKMYSSFCDALLRHQFDMLKRNLSILASYLKGNVKQRVQPLFPEPYMISRGLLGRVWYTNAVRIMSDEKCLVFCMLAALFCIICMRMDCSLNKQCWDQLYGSRVPKIYFLKSELSATLVEF